MIDIENDVFDEAIKHVTQRYPKVNAASEYVKSPAAFPHLSLYEADNIVLQRTQTGEHTENHVQVMYEANIYSNRANRKKQECRDIAMALDDAMMRMGFTRIMFNSIPNMNDASIYRITARYTAVVSKDKTIFRR